MKITVVGLGYIGLPTALMFANHGQQVCGVDVNDSVINKLTSGQIHIEEPGLQEELDKALRSGKFHAGKEIEPADAFIISVPTPNHEDAYKSCNLDYVKSAVTSVLPALEKGNTIIIESTIAPRSMMDHICPMVEASGFTVGKDVFLVHCPERVLPGQVMHELIYNNRIIGGITEACTEAGKKVYKTFVQGELLETTASVAEMSKLMENTYRDVNIALANELVKVCDELDIDALEVIELANKHPRVNLHSPGPGVGGHCLAVDPYFIIEKAPEKTPLIQAARAINSQMPSFIVQKVEETVQDITNPKIAVLGLTYKGNIDDIRESPAVEIFDQLAFHTNYQVVAFDPHVQVDFASKDFQQTIDQANFVLILADHNEFKNLTVEDFDTVASEAIILDTKNIATQLAENPNYYNLGNISELNKKGAHAL
ncbi:nucleotide sugar dehydrogenase [Listeria aquatica]|uniref:Nucleotide sugar dehydrogenase n=1 Tax=Listeria aquatica TaxID=1494960 RepID=A0A841ZP60_9LIST|nr:nucleotide sugar dehydrogenase [Listeria aquatica]MBC1521317.1 nucleotide sugar dehydrogenase [Listeria aquatica]